jgi:signal transduction histidine kinase
MRLYLETALDENEKNPTVRAEALNVVNQECRRLERLVSDILSITEIEAGSFKVKNEDVRMDAVLQDLQSDYKAQAESKGLRLVFDLPPKLPVLTGDRDKLAVALHNLVGNALKYTPPGGQVLVSAEVSAQDLLITVADSGIGISEEDAKNLFKKFQRAKDPRVAKIPGSGLGLALAREVVRLYGGDILLKSELNKGSTFTVVLPTRSEAA